MQEDFHYYATYCAAMLAGYSHEESLDICYSAQFVDLCSRTVLVKLGAPVIAATTQLQLELMDARTDIIGLQDITRIWASFHFLPRDLYADKPKRTKRYMHKYRLICGPNGDLVKKTVELAKDRPLQSVGIAMHVLADTWAHMYFAGTPSLVINDTSGDFMEMIDDADEVKITFRHNPSAPDDLDNSIYTNSLRQRDESSIMNLGHGRAGHLPDYSFIRYRYMPAWDEYRLTIKDNPSDYYKAFSQMVYAMKYLIGDRANFEIDRYDQDSVSIYEDRIREILGRRRLSASDDWKAFGEELSGETIPDFDLDKYQDEYIQAPSERKDETFIGRFIQGAIAQKTMVSEAIYRSGNLLAGIVQIGGS
ncbi:MAG: hypothetical protein K5673_05690 [Lachnospiraceae bacterium]|nr:hypothetical protein [Lachnospiraceae bacterium]